MTYQELRRRMIRDAAKHGIPVLGEFELTARCNFNCLMCYVADNTAKELDTKTWKRIFDDAVQAGLVFALMTGGDVFVRKDFAELYAHLYDAGVKITLFTNGALIDETILDILLKRPPEFIAITLYGASDETYRRVTGDKDGFTKVDNALKMLKETSLNIMLRTLPIKALVDDVDGMIAYAKHFGLPLSYAPYIAPPRCGDDVSTIRLSPSALIRFEHKMNQAFGKEAGESLAVSTTAATCAALKSAYFIDHRGMMRPCALASKPARRVVGSSFMETFRTLAEMFETLETYSGCVSCPEAAHCMQCVVRRQLEGGQNACAPYLLNHARKRKESL